MKKRIRAHIPVERPCKNCGTALLLIPDTHGTGLVALDRQAQVFVLIDEADGKQRIEVSKHSYVNHFSTCPMTNERLTKEGKVK